MGTFFTGTSFYCVVDYCVYIYIHSYPTYKQKLDGQFPRIQGVAEALRKTALRKKHAESSQNSKSIQVTNALQ